MRTRPVPGTELEYLLICYDEAGVERPETSAGGVSAFAEIAERLTAERVTDVFVMSHGWKGDVPAAVSQYERWIAAMASCALDRQRVRRADPEFKALLIGVHWPSLPWGEEDSAAASSYALAGADALDELVDDAAGKLADTDPARRALRVVFEAAADDPAPVRLPAAVAEAYRVAAGEAGLVGGGPAAWPGDDAESFDPEVSYQLAREAEAAAGVAFDGSRAFGLLSVLRQLSFWTMKRRARLCGQAGVADLLASILVLPLAHPPRVHLMGHSFGCIVMSAAVAGRSGTRLVRPVSTLFLVQGALSLWAFASAIPVAGGRPGCFHEILREGRVQGALVTTRSAHDTAVGTLYPLAAGLRQQVDFAPGELPKYGAIGAYGVQGSGIDPRDLEMKAAIETYDFHPGGVYNLDATEFIAQGGGLSGAHNDIARPEVAHAFWEAVLAAPRRAPPSR
jgi:hypothetical protein